MHLPPPTSGGNLLQLSFGKAVFLDRRPLTLRIGGVLPPEGQTADWFCLLQVYILSWPWDGSLQLSPLSP